MKQGYVKLFRKTLSSPIFAHEGMLKLFILCLLKANHKEAEVSIPGVLKPIKLYPGQFISGRYALHEDYHQAHIKKRYSRKAAPTPITLYRWLLTLQDMQILHIKTFNKYSIITVLNWHLYQENEQQMNNRRTSDEHKQECIKNEKELSADLYAFYLSEIGPEQKTRQRAIGNISHHLKKHTAENLQSAITNYKQIAQDRDPRYRKAPENFFQKREPFFIDYLPGNFKAPCNSTGSASPRRIIKAGDPEILANE